MRFLFGSLCLLVLASIPAFAQVKSEAGSTVSGKTFWHEDMPERYYFGEGGKFLLQYTQGAEEDLVGTVREGTWRSAEDSLCWIFTGEPEENCFTLVRDIGAVRVWGKFDDSYRLRKKSGSETVFWNRWMYGALITRPEIYVSIHAKKPVAFDSEAYRSSIVGKIMRLPMGYIYHDAGGALYSIEEKNVDRVLKDTKKLQDDTFLREYNINKVSWTLEGNRHCWVYKAGRSTCNTVISGRDLYVPQDGYVHIMDDNFIRLIKPSDMLSAD